MNLSDLSRRSFAFAAGALAPMIGAAASAATDEPAASHGLGISLSNAAIHQEVVFKATASRVYAVLTDAREFQKVVAASGAIPAMALGASPAQIGAEPGGAFSLFGGYITGRQIELSPGSRLVQAWRAQSWAPHIYSIARFELADHPDGALLAFDHTGFPNEEAHSLAEGWQAHYWAPMAKVLAAAP